MPKVEEVKISFFKVAKCGYYTHGAVQPSFSSLEDVLLQLQDWTKDTELSLTKIADPSGIADDHPVYLFGIRKIQNTWLFATWNEVPSTEAGVSSVSMNSIVGAPRVHANAIVKNSIPGFATYFWAIPGRNLIATIKFAGGRSGQSSMASYLGRFMSIYMRYAITENRGNNQVTVIGHTDKGDRVPMNVRPAFKTYAYQRPNRAASILSNVSRIRKVVRRGHITTDKVVSRAIWQGAMKYIRSNQSPGHVVKQRIYIEVDYRPTLVELKAMIAEEESDPDVAGWDDMGFLLDGDSTTHWLGKEHATGVFPLSIERIDAESVELGSLMKALHANANAIMAILT